MTNEGMSGFDLRKFQEEGEEQDKIKSIMGKILSGRAGYEAIIEKKTEKARRCPKCNWVLNNAEKFCPECGTSCKQLECDSANKNCEVVDKCES